MSTQIRKEEYQHSMMFKDSVLNPLTLRDYELASSARDALSDHHDRGFEDIYLSLRGTFRSLDLSLAAI